MKDSSIIILILAVAMSVITILAFLPVWQHDNMADWAGSWIVSFFRDVCHQQPDRMFELGNSFPAICSRCTGIYTGITLGLWASFVGVVYSVQLPRAAVISVTISTTLIIGIDVLAQWINLWEGSNLQRSVLGLIWGMAIVSIVLTSKKISKNGT